MSTRLVGVLALLIGTVLVLAGGLWIFRPNEATVPTVDADDSGGSPTPAGRAARPRLERSDSLIAARCGDCHSPNGRFIGDRNHFLNDRATLRRTSWADSARVTVRCSGCHAVPDPEDVPREWWGQIIFQMEDLRAYLPRSRIDSRLPEKAVVDLIHYFGVFSTPDSEMRLPADPAISARRVEKRRIGHPIDPERPPRIGHVQIVDLDGDDRNEVLVSDFRRHAVTWLDETPGDTSWTEETLVRAPYPGRVTPADLNGDGDLDLIIPDLGNPQPTDDRVGAVYVAWNQGDLEFERETILDGVGRTTDARPGDFDGDGDTDIVVSVFGAFRAGQIGWLERRNDGSYTFHRISSKAGGIHVPTVDLNGDGRLDFIAVISQEHEEVTAFLNRGEAGNGSDRDRSDSRFAPRTLYTAPSPTFGSSGIRLTDLDEDGDTDILYTNGDAYDVSPPMVLPSHGVQWLENRGDLEFEFHRLLDLYGAYHAVPGDFDGDGDKDVVAVSLISEWSDPTRKSIVWLENDGSEEFHAHGVDSAPNYIISADVGDLNGDDRSDVVTGHMHEPPQASGNSDRVQRFGRVTLWENVGAQNSRRTEVAP